MTQASPAEPRALIEELRRDPLSAATCRPAVPATWRRS